MPPLVRIAPALALLLALATGAPARAQAPPAAKPDDATPANAAPKPDPDEPRILSPEETARRTRSSSIFLAAPGADRYGEATNWAEVPAHRRASFYGVRSVAQTVVFVVDCSGSMGEGERLARAKIELRRAVNALQFPQKFTVIFYADDPIPMPGLGPKSADTMTKDQFVAWLRLIDADGGTDPRAAMAMALGLHPDAIYLLSDGAFPDRTVEDIATRNRKKIPIHCIDLAGGSAGDHLKRIARDSGGQYASRP